MVLEILVKFLHLYIDFQFLKHIFFIETLTKLSITSKISGPTITISIVLNLRDQDFISDRSQALS